VEFVKNKKAQLKTLHQNKISNSKTSKSLQKTR